MDNQDYLKGLTQGYGARVVIHDKGTAPFPAENGIFASTQYESAITLKLVRPF